MDIDDILADIDRDTVPQENQDLQSLTRVWVAERVAPELLPYPEDLMERVLERIARQIEVIEDQTGSMDPKTNFRLIVIQTELERFKFLVRSFLRARIAKIDAHALHYSQNSPHLLSPTESQYLSAHQSLLTTHYRTSFLAQFPTSLQRLDDTAGGISMIDKPDEDRAVFVRVLRDCGVVGVEGTDVRCEFRRGDVWVVRFAVVRRLLGDGDCELI